MTSVTDLKAIRGKARLLDQKRIVLSNTVSYHSKGSETSHWAVFYFMLTHSEVLKLDTEFIDCPMTITYSSSIQPETATMSRIALETFKQQEPVTFVGFNTPWLTTPIDEATILGHIIEVHKWIEKSLISSSLKISSESHQLTRPAGTESF